MTRHCIIWEEEAGILMARPRNNIDRLAGELKKLSEQLAPRINLARSDIDRIELEAFLAGEDSWVHYGGPGDNILFLSGDLQRRASLAGLIRDQFPGELSQQFLEDKLTQALFQLKGKQGKELWMSSRKCIGDLLAEVGSLPAQHEVIFPIVNLVLEAGALDFGPLTLHPRAEADAIAGLIQDLDHPLLQRGGLGAVKAYGIAKVRARDPTRVQNNALELAETAFNVIRLFRTYESYRWGGIIRVVAAQESALRIVWHRPIDDDPAGRDQRHSYRIGPLGTAAPFTIRPESLNWMRRMGFDEIVSLCFSEPGNKDDIHRRIRDSVRWAGQAKIAQDSQARFLGQWIALEVLLNPYEQNPVGRDVSDAAAFLLSKPTVEARTQMAKHFREFWKTRIRIVHKGETVSEEDCENLASDVTRAVSALTKKRAADLTSMREWFEAQKYTTAEDT